MTAADGSLDWLAEAGLEPQVFEHLSVLEEQLWSGDPIEAPLLELVRLRIAQILDAPAEVERRSPAAVAGGLDEAMVVDLSNWPTSPKFDERQRAVLSWAEQWVIDPEADHRRRRRAPAGVADRQGMRRAVDRARRVRVVDPYTCRARPRFVASRIDRSAAKSCEREERGMSTARIAPPEGGMSVFDHDPELWGTFNRFYGYLWTYGALDQPTKEAARLRNARVTGCPVCRNLRFDGAREQGLTEDYVEQIVDGYEKSDLPDRWKDAVRWTDAVIGYPAWITNEERARRSPLTSPLPSSSSSRSPPRSRRASRSRWSRGVARATCPPRSSPLRRLTAW